MSLSLSRLIPKSYLSVGLAIAFVISYCAVFYAGKMHERSTVAGQALASEIERTTRVLDYEERMRNLEKELRQAAREREQTRQAEFARAKKELLDEVVDNPECALTDGELRAYESLLRPSVN